MLTRILVALNNSTSYSLTFILNQVIYSFKTRKLLDLLRIENPNKALLAPNSV